jgi:YHS domain-containing protein
MCPKEFAKDPKKFLAKLQVAAPEKKPEAKPEKKPDAKKADAKPVNAKCPVSGEGIEAGFTSIFETKTVGFCCDKCKAKFDKDPKAFAAKIK